VRGVAKNALSLTLPISPLAGEMSGRTERGAVPPTYQPMAIAISRGMLLANERLRKVGVPSHPPLPCRASRPQGGRLADPRSLAAHPVSP